MAFEQRNRETWSTLFNPNQLSNIKQLHPDLKLPLMMTNISKTGRTGRGGGGGGGSGKGWE